jgi:hypothetical protein
MLKHLIKFDKKEIALDKKEIGDLFMALEPYYVALAMGVSDENVPEFVREYKDNVSKSRKMVKEDEIPVTNSEEPKQHYENNVYDFKRPEEKRKIK